MDSPMSETSRKVLNTLLSIAEENNIGVIYTDEHIYMLEVLCLMFYPNVIISTISQKIKKIKNLYSAHFSPVYWYDCMVKLFGKNKNVKAHDYDSVIKSKPNSYDAFNYIRKFIGTDYSYNTSLMVNKIINEYPVDLIINSCDIASNIGIYTVQYVGSVIRSEAAKLKAKDREYERLNSRIADTMNAFDERKNTYEILEIIAMNNKSSSISSIIEEESAIDKIYKSMKGGV